VLPSAEVAHVFGPANLTAVTWPLRKETSRRQTNRACQ
jgi:hypothetical protein